MFVIVGQSRCTTAGSNACRPDISRRSGQSAGSSHDVRHADDPSQRRDKFGHYWTSHRSYK